MTTKTRSRFVLEKSADKSKRNLSLLELERIEKSKVLTPS
jgi:hypothetical protein